MKYKKLEFSKFMGISASAVTKNLKIGALIEVDGWIDCNNPINARYIKDKKEKLLAKKEKTASKIPVFPIKNNVTLNNDAESEDNDPFQNEGDSEKKIDKSEFVDFKLEELSREELEEQLRLIYTIEPQTALRVQQYRKTKAEADKSEIETEKIRNSVFDRDTIRIFVDVVREMNISLAEIPATTCDDIIDIVKSEKETARISITNLLRQKIISVINSAFAKLAKTEDDYPLTGEKNGRNQE